MKRITLDFRKSLNINDAHKIMKDAFSFPDYYGKNLDALNDCISEITDDVVVDILIGKYLFDGFDSIIRVFNDNRLNYKIIKSQGIKNKYDGEIKILQLLDGAKMAEGLTVVIDVFRCFTFEAFALNSMAKHIYTSDDIDKCLQLKRDNSDYIIAGERDGVTLQGFDLGNSPAELLMNFDVEDKTIIHSTSSGVRGIVNAKGASEILGGSFVTAKAIAKYILDKNPKKVSLVCMGWSCVRPTDEDTVCAEYIKSLLIGEEMDLSEKLPSFKDGCGKHFFDNKDKKSFPMPDFFMCLMPNIFDFVLKAEYNEKLGLIEMKKVSI